MQEIKNLTKEQQRRIFRCISPLCDLDGIVRYMLDGVWKYCEDDEELIATIKELWGDEIEDRVELFVYVNNSIDKFITTLYSEDDEDDRPWSYLVWPDNVTKSPDLPTRAEYKEMLHELENQGYDLETSILLMLDNQRKSESN